MISCRGCEVVLESMNNFGLLVLSEPRGRNSYHLVIKNHCAQEFAKRYTKVDSELSEGKYYICYCLQCDLDFAKKFPIRGGYYIAFGKDKVIADTIKIAQGSKWIDFINKKPFNSLSRLSISDFSSTPAATRNQRTESYSQQVRRLGRGEQRGHPINAKAPSNNTFDDDDSRELNSKSRGGSQYSEMQSSFNDRNQMPVKGQQHQQPERDSVGSTVTEMVDYLKKKMSKWTNTQLIYEFTGPSKKNWETLTTTGLQMDMSGLLMKLIFQLLSHDEIKGSTSTSSSLYTTLNNEKAFMGMNLYLNMGPLAQMTVEKAIQGGRGCVSWVSAIDDALSVVETLDTMMHMISSCQSNPMIPVEILSIRIKRLIGESFSEDSVSLDSWKPGIGETQQQDCIRKARHLFDRMSELEKLQKGAIEAVLEETKLQAEIELEKKESSKYAKQRLRNGISFLDDPSRDRDYLKISVVPDAEELLSAAPTALPQNLVLSLGRSRQTEEDDDDEGQIAQKGPARTVTGNDKQRFRNIHHYLNTHFQLNREDCLAQLRRGIATFREQLGLNPVTNRVESIPSQLKLAKVAAAVSNSKGNNRVYVYGEVNVRSVDRMHDGIGYSVSFRAFGTSRSIDWSRSQRFMNGSLLCLSPDGTFNESTLVIATVLKGVTVPNGNNAGWVPTVTIGIDKASVNRFNPVMEYTMIESMVFFEAYRPVLTALQKLGADGSFPFEAIFLGQKTKVDVPSYLLVDRKVAPVAREIQRIRTYHDNDYDSVYLSMPPPVERPAGWNMAIVFPRFEQVHGTAYWNPLQTPKLSSLPIDPPLDKSQVEAIELALSKRLAIIQGPPGCGKTYVGVLISRLLLSNKSLRQEKPILFICQTNHALDQMMEHVYKYDQNQIRIGGRSESPIMQGLSIAQKKKSVFGLPRRSSEQYEALDRMNRSLVALRAAFAQRGIAVSNTTPDKMIFPNSVLARLGKILDSIQDSAGSTMLESLLNSSRQDVLESIWKTCSKIAIDKANANHTYRHSWTNDFKTWDGYSLSQKLLLMATYSTHQSDSILNIVDNWRLSEPKRGPKKQESSANADEWMTVEAKKTRKDVTTAKVDDNNDGDIEIFSDDDDDAAEDAKNRLLDDDSYDYKSDEDSDEQYYGPSNASNKEESQVERVIERSIDVNDFSYHIRRKAIPIGLDVWRLSRAERQKLAEAWADLLNIDAAQNVGRYSSEYRKAAEIDAKYNASVDSVVLQSRSEDVV